MNLSPINTLQTQQLASKLKKILSRALSEDDLKDWEQLVDKIATELNISHLQCAAVLASANKKLNSFKPKDKLVVASTETESFVDKPRMIRYRLAIGRKHNVTVADIKAMIIDETGVDIRQVGYIYLHGTYTLIDLPEGMPTDIYQHMKTVKINSQPLQIKAIQTGSRRQGKAAFKKSGRRNRRGNN